MNELTLAFLWYIVIGLCVVFYVVLDGFDLGVGMLHLFTKKDEDRRIFLNAIGPFWDGNEVWLVIVGGALFAGFPDVYATLFSGFYDLCMLLLCGLIFRAVAIEFRSKHSSQKWRQTWDIVFCLASLVIGFGIGLTFGHLIEGVPLDQHKNFTGTIELYFRPYPCLVGVFTCSLLMMHGAIFLAMKTEGALHNRLRRWMKKCVLFFFAMYLAVTIATCWTQPHMVARMIEEPLWFLIALAAALVILNVPRAFSQGRDFKAFLFSSLGIILLFCLYGVGMFPILVRSTIDPVHHSLTFLNSAASPLTLKVLLIIVAIGVPLVLAYGAMIYRIFRGKVKIGPTSY
jgi:cytochrome d ubiquinol oxidase subunit II